MRVISATVLLMGMGLGLAAGSARAASGDGKGDSPAQTQPATQPATLPATQPSGQATAQPSAQPAVRTVDGPERTPEPEAARATPWIAPAERDEFYDLDWNVLDHTGRAFNMRELVGRPMAVSLIYTQCPNPNMCPLMTVLMADLEQRLARAGRAGQARLVLISFDPTNDTPDVLRTYMAHRGIDFSSAIGIVPPEEQVKELVWEFGTNVSPIAGGLLGHSIDLFLIDAQGRFVRYYTGRVWDNEAVIGDLKQLIDEIPMAAATQPAADAAAPVASTVNDLPEAETAADTGVDTTADAPATTQPSRLP